MGQTVNDEFGDYPVHCAARVGATEAVAELVNVAGPMVVLAKNKKGGTACELAWAHGREDLMGFVKKDERFSHYYAESVTFKFHLWM